MDGMNEVMDVISLGFVLYFFEELVDSVYFDLILFLEVSEEVRLNADVVDFVFDFLFVDSEGAEVSKVHGEKGTAEIGEAFHDLLKVHF